MNKKILEILACPIDKHSPLELTIIKQNTIENGKDNSTQDKQEDIIIHNGVLFCTKCSRFYPIIEEIPIMLPDELRDKELEMKFLKDNRSIIPKKIIENANPWHL